MGEGNGTVRKLLPIAVLLLGAAGCTAQQVYDSTQALRINDCQRLAGAERDDCLARARMTYPEHEQKAR